MSPHRTLIRLSAVLAAVALVKGCGDGGSPTAPPPPEPARPTTVTVSPATAGLGALGATVQLTAEVRDQNGQVMAGATVTWSSSDESVATVNASGLVTGVAEAVATITASTGSASGSAVVTVMQPVASVEVSPSADTIGLGSTLELTAEGFDENGDAVEGAEFSWESSNASIATVDASGLVTGVAEGVATITASAGSGQGTAEITVMDLERAALIALYEATDGPNWVDSENWLTDTPLGEWYGVDTDAAGRVVGLDLHARWDNEARRWIPHGLSGPIPTELGNLANLEWLDLGDNNLSGPIPTELGNLANLESLDLGYNSLTGPILTELGNLASLESLDLRYNDLSGPIPAELGMLANLDSLRIRDNNLTGPIPTELGNLANLEVLSLGYSGLSGPIPTELGRLTNLQNLYLWGNELTGPIPAELGMLANLRWLGLSSNELTGPIPAELGMLANLQRLYLHTNNLTGPIPAELGSLANLEWLDLSRNELTGAIPRSLLNLTTLESFLFRGNNGLCAPGSADIAGWLEAIERSEGPFCNESDTDVLESLFEVTGGHGWTNPEGWLGGPALAEWHGVRADSLGRVTALDLSRNGLAGELPANLGTLAGMTELRIGGNALSGPLPLGLAELSLQTLHYAETELCAPAEASFLAWLNTIPSHEGTGVECAPLSDRDILVALYNATGGPNWTNADNWLTDRPLRSWYGVETDGNGQVTRLSLDQNGLSGPIPLVLGRLTSLEYVSLPANGLTGPIPPELGNLANLEWMDFYRNSLTGPIPTELGDLANLASLNLYGNRLSGSIPLELGKLANLRGLHLDRNRLFGPIPTELGNLANLASLGLQGMSLSGPIPPELGSLANLTRLDLAGNGLSGPIPPELGSLAKLRILWLDGNGLSGPIPPEFGNLANLEWLRLGGNSLSGPVPAELGNLANLARLYLYQNRLSGPIPVELGNLANLTLLNLSSNSLSGPIPPQLDRLAALEELYLDFNDLTGPVPPEFSGLAGLTHLGFAGNAGLSGALPATLTELRGLEALLAGGTDLCAPLDSGFQAWLETVHKRRIAPCADAGASMAYVTQAVQSREFPVPLVAGEEALLRVFVTAARATTAGIPSVRATFYVNGTEQHVADIPAKTAAIPTEVYEGNLSRSANAEVPGEIVRPGLEMVIEIDPEGTLDPGLGVVKRIPEIGRLAVDVREMPLFDLTLIPFIWTQTQDASIVDLIDAMAADPENHEMLEETRTLLPVGGLEVTAHEPVLSASNHSAALSGQTSMIRALEAGTGHYLGMMSRPVAGPAGLGGRPGRSAFAIPYGGTIAHELGHNMSLQHAPCGGAGGPDPSFPYPDGSIGAWGYDFRGGGRLVEPQRYFDVMSYCEPAWISDYYFTNALHFRLFDEGAPRAAVVAATSARTRSLLLWGGIGVDSVPYLEPTFVVDAPPELPRSGGEYRLVGRSDGGRELFSLSFDVSEVADGDGSSSFAFVLPVRPEWEGSLAGITLSGPDGSVTLDGNSDSPMAILRNPRSGQVRGILRDLPQADAAAALAPQAGGGPDSLDVLFSRGIPEAAAWQR